MSGVTTSSLSLAWSLRNWVILDYEEVVSLTISPWAPFFSLSFLLMGAQGQGIECVLSRLPLDSGTKTRPTLSRESRSQGTENPFTLESHAWDIINFSAIPRLSWKRRKDREAKDRNQRRAVCRLARSDNNVVTAWQEEERTARQFSKTWPLQESSLCPVSQPSRRIHHAGRRTLRTLAWQYLAIQRWERRTVRKDRQS